MPLVTIGTAHLYALVDPLTSGQVLEAAWAAGARRFDTAPSYGHGRSEPALGTFLAGREGVKMVSTKVGLLPTPAPGLRRRLVAAGARTLLPAPVADRLRARRAGGEPTGGPSGRFEPAAVRESVSRSLAHLGGRVDRLLLHEVQPDDVGDELLGVLERLLASGDVGAVGVATQNHLTAQAVARCGPVASVAHLAVGPLHPAVALPEHVRTRVGHGLLGGGGSHLKALRTTLESEPDLRDRWHQATTGTAFEGPGGLADALLARAASLDVTDVVVATSRPDRVARTYACASGELSPDPAVVSALDALVARTAPTGT